MGMDILRSRNLLVGTILATAIGLTACDTQQYPIYSGMGIIETHSDGQASAIECVAPNDHPDDKSIVEFHGPNVAIVQKSQDSAQHPFNYTMTLSGSDGTLQSFLKKLNTDKPGAYHSVTEQLVNEKTDEQLETPCEEKLGKASNLPTVFVGKFAFLLRSLDGRNKIRQITGPVDGMNVITADGTLLQDNGQPLMNIDVFYK